MNEPLFERCPHDKENPYVQVSRALIQDKSISPKAKGVLIYLLSLPRDWKVYHSQLQDGLNIGEDYLNSAMEELIEAGYADRSRERVKGVFQPYRYKFREFKKCSPKPKTPTGDLSDSPGRENRPGSSGPENPAVQIKDSEKKETHVCKRLEPLLEENKLSDNAEKTTRQNGALTFNHTIHPPKGEPYEISKEEIYRRSIGEYANHKWTNAEIAEAWECLINSKAPIINAWRYLEKTIEGIRMNLKKKQQAQYCKRNSITTNNIKESVQCSQEINTLQTDSKARSENCKKNSAEKSTSALVSPSSFKPIQLQGASQIGYYLRNTSSSGQAPQAQEKLTSNHV